MREASRAESTTRYSGRFALVLFALLAVWFAIIALVDPRRELWGSGFPAIQPNSRAIKLAAVTAYAQRAPVNALIFGSSRAFALDPSDAEAAGIGRTFNLAVHSGGIRDQLAMYRVVRARGIRPTIAVLGIDEGWLSGGFQETYDLTNNRTLQGALDSLGRPPAALGFALQKAERIFTPGYGMDALRSLNAWRRKIAPRTVFDSTGRAIQQRADSLIAAGTLKPLETVTQSVGLYFPALATYVGPDAGRRAALVALLTELKRDNVRLIAFLTPYHTQALALMRQRARAAAGFANARRDVMDVFGRAGVPLLDTSDPAAFADDPNEWYDAVHMRRANGARVLRYVVKRGL